MPKLLRSITDNINQIKQVISSAKKIYLSCTPKHPLMNIAVIKKLAEIIEENDLVTSLTLNRCALQDLGIIHIVEALKINRSITKLKISDLSIRAPGFKALADLLRQDTCRLTDISFSNFIITNEDMQLIVEALKINKSLKYVDLHNFDNTRSIDHKILDNLIIAIDENPNIEVIRVASSASHTQLKNVAKLSKIAIKNLVNEQIDNNQDMNIENNSLHLDTWFLPKGGAICTSRSAYDMLTVKGEESKTDKDKRQLKNDMKKLKKLINNLTVQENDQISSYVNKPLFAINEENIDEPSKTSNNKIIEDNNKPKGLKELIAELTNSDTRKDVTTIILTVSKDYNESTGFLKPSHHKTCSEKIKDLLKQFNTPNSVLHLNLSKNNLVLCNAIKLKNILEQNNCILESLDLSHDKLTDRMVESLACGLKSNHSITHLSLCGTSISDFGVAKIAGALGSIKNGVTHLYLSNNRIGDAGTEAIASMLAKSKCCIQYIDLHNNQIGYEGMQAIAQALKLHKANIYINFLGNDISPQDMELINNQLKLLPQVTCKQIEEVDNSVQETEQLSQNPIITSQFKNIHRLEPYKEKFGILKKIKTADEKTADKKIEDEKTVALLTLILNYAQKVSESKATEQKVYESKSVEKGLSEDSGSQSYSSEQASSKFDSSDQSSFLGDNSSEMSQE